MKDLNPAIFILPVTALILAGVCYWFFLKKASNKRNYKFLIVIIFILAFILNLAWELLQGPLYSGFTYNAEHMSFCALASIADAIMVVLLYFALTLIYKNVFWIRELTVKRILLIMLIGGIGAVLAEARHVQAGSWIYNDSMPIIPYTNVGLSPILQFIILPGLIYFLSGYLLKVRDSNGKRAMKF
ncbi:hypothetical protein [Daejeonella sp. JGW-45]|uniref:hypothetical protein n=1 Tax=Daejeonella sp. JGW-45 TaxID=3034148 RepID=UPI0023EA8BE7|nr:hypothetical protein [Daejeonella sp. JGW-45]